MFLRYEDQCMDCAVPAYPCSGNSCPYKKVAIYKCDKCGEEFNGTYYSVDYEESYNHVCQSCMNDIVKDEFKRLSIADRVEVLSYIDTDAKKEISNTLNEMFENYDISEKIENLPLVSEELIIEEYTGETNR